MPAYIRTQNAKVNILMKRTTKKYFFRKADEMKAVMCDSSIVC